MKLTVTITHKELQEGRRIMRIAADLLDNVGPYHMPQTSSKIADDLRAFDKILGRSYGSHGLGRSYNERVHNRKHPGSRH